MTCCRSSARCRPEFIATPFNPFTGTLTLDGFGSHSAYETAIRADRVQHGRCSVGVTKNISVSVFDDFWWSNEAHAIFTVTSGRRVLQTLDLDANNSTGFGVDASATYTAGGAAVPVTDTDVLITDDGRTIQSATINILDYSLHPGDTLSIAGTLPTGITASSYNPFTGIITLSGSASLADYQTALRQVVFSSTDGTPSTHDRDIQVSVNDGFQESNFATMYMHVVIPPPNTAPVLDLDFEQLDDDRRKLSHRVYRERPAGTSRHRGRRRSGHRQRQSQPRLGHDHAHQPAGRRPSDLRRNTAARHPGFRLGHKSSSRSRASPRPATMSSRCGRSDTATTASTLRTSPGPSRLSSMTAPSTATPRRRLSRSRR